MRKKLIVSFLMIMAFCSYANDQYDNAEPFYSFSYEIPGDAGDGGGAKLVEVRGDDIFDQDAKYPYELNLINFFWKAFSTKKVLYSDIQRHSMKYAAVSVVYLSDIYLYTTKSGKNIRAMDIETYYIRKDAVMAYYDPTYAQNSDGLLPFRIIDLEGFKYINDDGEVVLVEKSAIKIIRYMNQ